MEKINDIISIIKKAFTKKIIIGRDIYIEVISGGKNIKILAKVDTGAYSSSISKEIASTLDLDNTKKKEEKKVKSSLGISDRGYFTVKLISNNKEIDTEINIADRTNLEYPMIIGRKDLSRFDFLVDVKNYIRRKKKK